MSPEPMHSGCASGVIRYRTCSPDRQDYSPQSPLVPFEQLVTLAIIQGLTEFLPVSSSGHLHLLDLVTIAIYASLVLYVGWRYSRRQVSTEEYFVAGRGVQLNVDTARFTHDPQALKLLLAQALQEDSRAGPP